jgi:hypothetical protein
MVSLFEGKCNERGIGRRGCYSLILFGLQFTGGDLLADGQLLHIARAADFRGGASIVGRRSLLGVDATDVIGDKPVGFAVSVAAPEVTTALVLGDALAVHIAGGAAIIAAEGRDGVLAAALGGTAGWMVVAASVPAL